MVFAHGRLFKNWDSFNSGLTLFDGSTGGTQNSGDILTSSHADDAAGREPNLTTRAIGTIYNITNIDFLMDVLAHKGGAGGGSLTQSAVVAEEVDVIEGVSAAAEHFQGVIDHIAGHDVSPIEPIPTYSGHGLGMYFGETDSSRWDMDSANKLD